MTTYRRLVGIAGGDRGSLATEAELRAAGFDPALMLGRYLEQLPGDAPAVVAAPAVVVPVVVVEPVEAEELTISSPEAQEAIWGDEDTTEEPAGITDVDVNNAIAAVQGVATVAPSAPKHHNNKHNKGRR